jgi:hypothetical protein
MDAGVAFQRLHQSRRPSAATGSSVRAPLAKPRYRPSVLRKGTSSSETPTSTELNR